LYKKVKLARENGDTKKVAVLDAPQKEIVWFEHSGHNPWINESALFVQELLKLTGENQM